MSKADHNDLRGAAIDQKRERTSQHKWCPRYAQHQRPTRVEDHSTARARPLKWAQGRANKLDSKQHAKNVMARLPALPAADPDYSPDLAAEPDGWTWDGAPDESSSAGERILEDAINRAEHTFEDKKTTKLVKDEYDVVDDAAADDDDGPSSQAVEDEFEML